MNTCETKTNPAVRQPAFTSREDDQGLHLQIALPGVRKEDVKLTSKQALLHIEAVRESNVPDGWKTHAGPTGTVSYQLTARLGLKYDGSNAKAFLENGILDVDIPVREEAKPREILVN